MRPVTVRQAAAGFTPWVVLDRMVSGFGPAIEVKVDSAANLTYSVEHTLDDLALRQRPTSVIRVGTVATVIFPNHGLKVNDWVQPDNTGDANLDGPHNVASVVDVNTFTYTVANTGALVGDVINQKVVLARVTPNSQATAKTGDVDTNYSFPPSACRLNITAYVAGSATMLVNPAGGI